MAPVHRVPQIQLAAILAQQNPQIDLKLEAYESSTRNFLKAVTNYKNRAIATITERRASQENEKKRIQEKSQAFETETNQCKLKEIDLVETLEREKEERKDAELSVAALKRQFASQKDKCSTIEAEIEEYRAITANLRRERDKERTTLSAHALQLSPELQNCENCLSCVIEGMGKERLLIRFHELDKSDVEKEFSFVIDVSGTTYKVVTSSPPLNSLSLLVENLNDTKDIFAFIRQMREAFRTQTGIS